MRGCVERKRSTVRRRQWVSRPPAVKPEIRTSCLCSGDGMVAKSVVAYPGRSAGFRVSGRSENERTRVDDPAEVGGSHRTEQPSKGGLNRRRSPPEREGDPGQPTPCQLAMVFGTAENEAARASSLVDTAVRGVPRSAVLAGPKPEVNEETGTRAMLSSNPRRIAPGLVSGEG